LAIKPDFYTTAENIPLFVPIADGVLANDSEPNGPLKVVGADLATTDQGFQIKILGNGSLEYLPGPGFSGTDTFTYTVQDQLGTQFTGQIHIDVTPTAAQPELRMADASLTGLTTVGPDQVVAIPGTLLQGAPVAFAALSNGGFAFGFQAVTDPSPQHNAFVQVYGADGLAVGAPIELPNSAEPVDNVQLATLPGGGFMAAWHPGTNTGDQPISLQIFDNSGTAVGSPISLGNATTIRGNPSLTALSNGNVAVTWGDLSDGLLVQIVEPDGTLLGSPTVLEPGGDPRSMSAITPDVNGGFIVAWRLNDSGNSSVSAQRYDANGAAVGAPILVTGPESATEILTRPSVTGLANGGFAVTWADFEKSPSILNVHSQAFGANNLPVGAEFSSAQTFNGSLFGTLVPRITELAHGYVVSWEAGAERFGDLPHLFASPGADRMANYFQVFDDNGNALSGAVLAHVDQTETIFSTTRSPPIVTPLPNGGFAMRFNNFISGANPDMNAVVQLFDAHGNRVGNEALASQSASDVQHFAMLGVLTNGELVASYVQDTSVSESLHVQKLDFTTSLSVLQDGGPITLPLNVETTGAGDTEAINRVVLSGLPDGTRLTPPAGMIATFHPAHHLWTLTGTIPATFSVTLKLTAGYAGSLDVLATAFAKDVGATTETASAPLSIPINVTLLHGETIVVPHGRHLVDATHTVAGQPLPTVLSDLIISHGGHNTIRAGGGNDTVITGPGHDALFGGPGADIFVFRHLAGDTSIGDFVHREDKIALAKSIFLSLAHIHYDRTTGDLSFYPLSGWNQPVHFAKLSPHLHINAHDFMFV
jgi:hypothetical protein